VILPQDFNRPTLLVARELIGARLVASDWPDSSRRRKRTSAQRFWPATPKRDGHNYNGTVVRDRYAAYNGIGAQFQVIITAAK